ncbi:uncharacterized protein GGS22DRAFT_174539 [Annulohypoxylon maeteangense]|uniref:uncharacterized protein n=1 Tax=Annulohypoxylon maeteangense TaxID=1927788 RepID=UPI0020078EB1|nr:uncharacterized protein GGS22DRAFT_174539 [Annulohypoxylon maeteangense]KAI0880692.1 hypothetical protein GGS22DRAFT_174539 [Annulohypoxylon maeteangense]
MCVATAPPARTLITLIILPSTYFSYHNYLDYLDYLLCMTDLPIDEQGVIGYTYVLLRPWISIGSFLILVGQSSSDTRLPGKIHKMMIMMFVQYVVTVVCMYVHVSVRMDTYVCM